MNQYQIRCRCLTCIEPGDPFADQLPNPVVSLDEHLY